jgi:uncharacterized membrane protein YkvA (DUF1232 family)
MKKKTIFIVAAIIIGFLYGFAPVDLIPDSAPMVGFIDDILIFITLMGLAWWIASRMKEVAKTIPFF